MFEGAMRFWILPSLANPLLYVRDPVVVLIYVVAAQTRVVRSNGYIVVTFLLGVITALLAMILGDGRWDVTLIGLRTNFLHIPLIFVIGAVLNPKDLSRIARWTILIALPMAILVVYQFRSPFGSWINQGGMHTHYGTVRPAGTFSFAAGLSCYLSLLAAFLVQAVLRRYRLKFWQLVAGTLSLAMMLLVSGSRTAVAAVAVVLLIGAFASTRLKGGTGAIAGLLIVGLMAFGLISSTEFGEEGAVQLRQRFKDTSTEDTSVVGGLAKRLKSVTTGTLEWAMNDSILGHGIGSGTSAGGFLLTGERTMLGGEAEWGRVLFEMGTPLGLIFISLRIGLVIVCIRLSLRGFLSQAPGPMIMFGCAWLHLLCGQWGIPSLQGFAALSAGLCLASFRCERLLKLKVGRSTENMSNKAHSTGGNQGGTTMMPATADDSTTVS